MSCASSSNDLLLPGSAKGKPKIQISGACAKVGQAVEAPELRKESYFALMADQVTALKQAQDRAAARDECERNQKDRLAAGKR